MTNEQNNNLNEALRLCHESARAVLSIYDEFKTLKKKLTRQEDHKQIDFPYYFLLEDPTTASLYDATGQVSHFSGNGPIIEENLITRAISSGQPSNDSLVTIIRSIFGSCNNLIPLLDRIRGNILRHLLTSRAEVEVSQKVIDHLKVKLEAVNLEITDDPHSDIKEKIEYMIESLEGKDLLGAHYFMGQIETLIKKDRTDNSEFLGGKLSINNCLEAKESVRELLICMHNFDSELRKSLISRTPKTEEERINLMPMLKLIPDFIKALKEYNKANCALLVASGIKDVHHWTEGGLFEQRSAAAHAHR